MMTIERSSSPWGALALVAMLGGILALAFNARADDDFSQDEVTYSKDVAPILFQNCVSCHRPGEAAPMTLLNYADTRPWAKSIKKSVANLEMPPWDANPAHGKWANDLSLTEQEIATISKWVDQGAKEGDPSLVPPLPKLTEGWQLGEPDYIIELDEVEVPATGNDLFPNLSVTVDVPEKRWLRALEVRPGNNTVLHHVVLFTSGVGMTSAAGTFDALAVWAVGTPPVIYPEGMGRWVNPKMRLTSNMHYHPSGTAAKDKTRVGLYFGQGELKKEITSALAGTISFAIPPRVEDYKLTATYYVNQDIQVVSLFPHMHMRGKEMTFTATYPDGRKEILLNVPKYDFNWQWFYYPESSLVLPADTEIEIEAHYDNSANNPNNPDPDITLTFGEQSDEEMMFGFLEFVAVDGVKPKPISAQRLLAKIAAKHPADEVFSVQSGMGMMSMKTLLHLPKQGDGTWFISFGGSVMPIPLKDVKWHGNEYSFQMDFMGGRMGAAMTGTGNVDEAGNITGSFDMDSAAAKRFEERQKEFEASLPKEATEQYQRDSGSGRRGRGGFGFMSDFKGTRFNANAGEVSSAGN